MTKKLKSISIIVLYIIWILLTPSFYQKGGIESQHFFIIFTIGIFLLADTLFLSIKLIGFELILIGFLFTSVSLFITTLLAIPSVVDLIHADRTWELWETKNRLMMNGYFALTNLTIFSVLAIAYLQIKKLLYSTKA